MNTISPFARELALATSKEVDGTPFVMVTEALTGTPTTAHILGGCVIGADAASGVIDINQQVFGYKNLFVCDGSAISANPRGESCLNHIRNDREGNE